MATQAVTIEGTEYSDPSTAQRLIAKIDRDGHPAGGYENRCRVISREILPLDVALEGIDLTPDDISLLGWLVEFGQGARVAAFISRIRAAA